MKTNTANDTVVERDGIASDGAFQIQFNAKMAKILSDGLYSNKIQAIIRELSCNAIDSHVEAGCISKPIEVHLPTTFEPWFYVRDFGVGLDHQQVLNIYTVYGASTKTNSNDFVGQLGLGSKSPFSYVDAFDVTARKNGVERQYSMYKNESGMPSVALLGEFATSEPNGVTVKMPVKEADIRRFSSEAAVVFRWFETLPVFTGATGIKISTPENVYTGSTWSIRKYDNVYSSMDNRPFALMGRVAYPIDVNAIDNLTVGERACLSMPVTLQFAIGDLEVAASRESLGYDARTQQNIRAATQRVLDELGSQFAQAIASAETEWDARVKWGEIFSNSNHFKQHLERAFGNVGILWREKLIREAHVTFATHDIYPDTTMPQVYRTWHAYKTIRQEHYHSELLIRCDKNHLVVFNDLPTGALSRVNWAHRCANFNSEILMFGPGTVKTREEILAMLGNPPSVLASELPRKPSQRSERIKMLAWVGGHRTKNVSNNWQSVDCDLDDGGIYVTLDRYTVMFGTRSVDLQNYINYASELGIISKDTVIYSPRAEMRNKVTEHPDWTNLFDLIKQTVEERLTTQVRQAIADNAEYQRVIGINRDTTLWQYPLVIKNPNSLFSRFAQGMRQIEAINAANKNLNLLVDLAAEFSVAVDLPPPSVSVFSDIQQVFATYPMLAMAMDKYSIRNLNPSTATHYQDYINMVDEFSEQIIQQGVKNLVSA